LQEACLEAGITARLYVAAACWGIALCLFTSVGTAQAAESTNVLDAFDGDKPFDAVISLQYEHVYKQSRILREWICQTNDNPSERTGTNPLCPGNNEVLDTRQMISSEQMNVLNINIRAGLAPDLEFHMTLPLILGWQSELKHDDGVSGNNSLVDSPLTPSIFKLPYKSGSRRGLGDLTFGMKYAPLNGDRDPMKPSWLLGVEYLAPTAKVRQAGKDTVGGGVHALSFYTALSRRVTNWMEPWFEVRGILRFRDGAPFDHKVTTQTLIEPGHKLGLSLGTEFYPWKQPSEDAPYLAIGLTASALYTAEGREFTELFDALGSSDCDPSQNCGLTLYTRYGAQRDDSGDYVTSDGVTDVEQYGTLGGELTLIYQPLRFIKLQMGVKYSYVTSHFLTFADAGKDLDKQGNVQRVNSRKQNEYNPKYNENIDDLGRRFRTDDSHMLQVMFSIEGQI